VAYAPDMGRTWLSPCPGDVRSAFGYSSAACRRAAEPFPNNSRSSPEGLSKRCRRIVEAQSNNCRTTGSNWQESLPITANHCQKLKKGFCPSTFVTRKQRIPVYCGFHGTKNRLVNFLNFFNYGSIQKRDQRCILRHHRQHRRQQLAPYRLHAQ